MTVITMPLAGKPISMMKIELGHWGGSAGLLPRGDALAHSVALTSPRASGVSPSGATAVIGHTQYSKTFCFDPLD
ncbi:hypothetical protein NSTCB13_02289 [Nostoc sp. DSM 114160]|jgi:hypothetical protein